MVAPRSDTDLLERVRAWLIRQWRIGRTPSVGEVCKVWGGGDRERTREAIAALEAAGVLRVRQLRATSGRHGPATAIEPVAASKFHGGTRCHS